MCALAPGLARTAWRPPSGTRSNLSGDIEPVHAPTGTGPLKIDGSITISVIWLVTGIRTWMIGATWYHQLTLGPAPACAAAAKGDCTLSPPAAGPPPGRDFCETAKIFWEA